MAVLITEALDIIYKNITPVSTEIIPIEMALGRVLSEDLVASFDLPRFDNSAMDGFAVKCEDAGSTVTSEAVIYAGDNPEMTLQNKQALRIMTGAPIPKGGEAIVPFEHVTENGNKITLPAKIEESMHIRRAGEDMKSGVAYLHIGDSITAYGITLLASQGVTHVQVYRKVKVAVFSSGDELRSHFESIEAHQLYNSNTPMFLARAKALGCEVSYVPNIGDTVAKLEDAIRASLNADIIVTSGGMSMGDKDYTKEAFSNCGMEHYFDRVEIKPGKPTAFGKINHTAVINLPGNPLASMVNYEIFIRTVIHKMSGSSSYYHHTIDTVIAEEFQAKKGKFTVTLGTFNGQSFMPLRQQMAGMVAPMQKAEAMMITQPDIRLLKKGDSIKIIPISWEFFGKEKMNFYTV